MLDNLLGNKTNILILRFLTKFDNQFFSIDEIAEETGAGLRNLYDSLRILSYENILMKRVSSGKVHYKFIVDSKVEDMIHQLFAEEKKRLFLLTSRTYKILSEIESKIIKVAGSNLIDILLFGSIAKGRDTTGSDIDLCVLIKKKSSKVEKRIKAISFDKKFKRDIQVHIFTLEEFIAADKNRNPLVRNIIRDGLSLKIGK